MVGVGVGYGDERLAGTVAREGVGDSQGFIL